MQTTVLIIDFGSSYTQLIARRVREQMIYCEIHPFNNLPKDLSAFKAVILSGSTAAISKNKPWIDLSDFRKKAPVLAIGYSAVKLLEAEGGQVKIGSKDEFHQKSLHHTASEEQLFKEFSHNTEVWRNLQDNIFDLPDNTTCLAKNDADQCLAFQINDEETFGLNFHPEVYQSPEGTKLIQNFLVDIAQIEQSWTPGAFVEQAVRDIKKEIGDEKVVLGLSGGVDSTVTAVLLNQAIGENLYCIFVNHGLLRKNEYESVLENYKDMGLNVKGVDASKSYLDTLSGVSDPEEKRKIIGKLFIETIDEEAQQIKAVKFL